MSLVQIVKDDLRNTESYLVAHKSYVEAWISSHAYVFIGVGVLVGWALCAGYHHVFPGH